MLRTNTILNNERLWYRPTTMICKSSPVITMTKTPEESIHEESIHKPEEFIEVVQEEEEYQPFTVDEIEIEEPAQEEEDIKEELVKRDIEEEEEIVVIPTTSVPPDTPSSMHSIIDDTLPRTTSLIKREKSKFNDRRKSLTHKLKKALKDNKRNSL